MKFFKFDLQLFAEGSGDGAAAPTGEQTASPVTQSTPAESGEAGGAQTPARQSLSDLLKSDAEYSKEYTQLVSSQINKRMSKVKAEKKSLEQQNSGMREILTALNYRYGLNEDSDSFLEELKARVTGDTNLVAEEASKAGLDTKTYLALKEADRIKRQNEAYVRQQQEQEQMNRVFEQINAKSENAKKQYPDFDLSAEMQNEQFFRLVAPQEYGGVNIDPVVAYEVCHPEVKAGVLQSVAQQAQTQAVNIMQNNLSRPTENGVSNTAAAVASVDFGKWTKADFEKAHEEYLRTGKKPF